MIRSVNQLYRLYYTLRPLKPRQWWYRLANPILQRLSVRQLTRPAFVSASETRPVVPLIPLQVAGCYDPERHAFRFLNLEHAFPGIIDWNFAGYGLLWTYNLNYFEWLYDERLSAEQRLKTIRSYMTVWPDLDAGLQPYPTSLRIVAWVRFLLRHSIRDQDIDAALYRQAAGLSLCPEYHLDGNHLWENALALLAAGAYFNRSRFLQQGKALLSSCVKDQLFTDGGHKEGSPMYHSLLLWRTLQILELLRATGVEQELFMRSLTYVAKQMSGWLAAVTFSDGTWPAVNDSVAGIAPVTDDLLEYAMSLGLSPGRIPLADSGYRMIREEAFELFIDAAPISPAFQPGHAHADTGTFCLQVRGKPLIVDTGVSTYMEGPLRQYQRSTAAHNTLCVNGRNSSDVWKSFRVGRRAEISGPDERGHSITLSHNGYAPCIHERTFRWGPRFVEILDGLSGGRQSPGKFFLHFHPDVVVRKAGENSFTADGVTIGFEGCESSRIGTYECAAGFNILRKSSLLEVITTGETLITIFRIT